MTIAALAHDFASFRQAARPLLAADVAPADVHFRDPADGQLGLLEQPATPVDVVAAPTLRVPRRYMALAELAALYRADDRFDLLYRVLFRLTHGAPDLLDDEVDPDVRQLGLRAQAVRKDEHRMHAFVRFRRVVIDGQERFVAYFQPEHHSVRLAAPFFARRFASMRWSILTPDESAHWNGEALEIGPGVARASAPPAEAELEDLFRTYYASTYNPARTNHELMRKHIPPEYARHMPEIGGPELLERSSARARGERAQAAGDSAETAASLVPDRLELPALREAAAACRACPSGELGGPTVFGEGAAQARLCLVGEQPGDEEDRRGRPFVGPAGAVLDRALAEANIERDRLYVTNAVKHFTYVWRGKHRLHQKPSVRVVRACKPWLDAELRAVQPVVILCLGATAAQSFLGPRFSITRNRGRVFETPWAKAFIVTYHPSAILRMQDESSRDAAYAHLVEDLRLAESLASGGEAAMAALPAVREDA